MITFSYILKDFIKSNKSLAISYATLTLLYPIKNIFMSHLMGKIAKNFSDGESITYFVVLLVTVVVIIQVLATILDMLIVKIFPVMQKHIRNLVINKIYDDTSKNFYQVETGFVISQILKFPYIIYGFVQAWLDPIIPVMLTAIFAAVYMLYHNVFIGVLFFVFIGIFAILMNKAFDVCGQKSRLRDSLINTIYHRIDDSLNNMKTVMTFNKQSDEIDRINETHPKYAQVSIEQVMCSLKIKYTVNMFLMYITVLTICSYFFNISIFNYPIKTTKDTLVSLTFIFYLLYTSFDRFYYSYQESIFKWGTITNTLAIINAIDKSPKNMKFLEYRPTDENAVLEEGITFDKVSFKYDSKTLLDDVSVTFPKNKKCLLVGSIGAGKSTVLNLILKYYQPMSGMIWLNDTPYSALSPYNIRRRIAYLPQNPLLFNRSIYDNILFGLEDNVTKLKVYEVVQKLGITGIIEDFKDGLDTIAGVNGSNLSGGQKQIVWIIKFALLDPECILLDEPSASLDANIKKTIHRLLETIMKNKTVIIVTHDEYLKSLADITFRLEKGKINRV